MQAIQTTAPGGPENMYIGDYPMPVPQPHEVLVKVHATALNRADTLQRAGKYPVPPGDSPLMGLEIAGVVEAVGTEVKQWQKGERICGLVNGGGYAEYCVIHEDMGLSIPKNMDYTDAAAIPEVFLTALQALQWLGKIKEGEKVLIHAGASGVGTAAIQLAELLNVSEIYATASAQKHKICYQLGADVVIDYKTENFADIITERTAGKGVDVIIDFVAAPYLQQNLQSLAVEGRLVVLAFLGGVMVENLNLAALLRKRVEMIGTTLRPRSQEYKIKLTKALQNLTWAQFAEGEIKPIIDSVVSWRDVTEAHTKMERNENVGKIVMRID